MPSRPSLLAAILAAVLLPVASVHAEAPITGSAARPLVVELFTSQGCSSCPPADANLGLLAGRDGILALSFGVTYWDRLGWADTFAQPAFTRRQRDYAAALGNDHVYTPQMLVGGQIELIGNRLEEIERALASLPPPGDVPLSLGAAHVAIGAAARPGIAADVWLVRYEPGAIAVPVGRGENGGRTLAITHAVRELTHLGNWHGAPVSLAIPAGKTGLKRAILVQAKGPGAILAAAAD